MRILHYSLGLPPYRTGGLTKYCMDLMLTQKEQGLEAALLWPGQICCINKTVRIKKKKTWNSIDNFEIINPLPIALDEGVLNVPAYTRQIVSDVYTDFLREYNPDVIHIHTLMGLHQEFLNASQKLKIKTVFTSHDYYGICPKTTLFRNGKACEEDHDCEDCIQCNLSALSLKKIVIMQSPVYRTLKDTLFVRWVRQRHRQRFFKSETPKEKQMCASGNSAENYRQLRSYYISMLKKIDVIHFNSTVSEGVYRRYFEPALSCTVSLTHRDIADCRRIKDFSHENLRFTYLGPAKPFKGFQLLLKVLDKLWMQGVQNFELHMYSAASEKRPYISHQQDGYLYSQLENIFDETDLLLVPSLWYETFGFTVLEALSYGVPVLVSENVGAKDLIKSIGTVSRLEVNEMASAIQAFCEDHTLLAQCNQLICGQNIFEIMDLHYKKIQKYCY